MQHTRKSPARPTVSARTLALAVLLSGARARQLRPAAPPGPNLQAHDGRVRARSTSGSGILVAAELGSAVGPRPMFTAKTMPAVSPTLHCVMSLSIQYFIIYTVWAIIRTANQFEGFEFFGAQKILETATTTVTYAPMLCVLFLAARIRAIQLSQGETEKYKLPQPWVQAAMMVCAAAVLAQVVIVLVLPIFTGEMEVETDDEGHLDLSHTQGGGTGVVILSMVRYVIMACLYGGFTALIVGVLTMQGPKEIWGDSQIPVSPAVMCTIILTTIFFSVYLMVALTKTAVELAGMSRFLLKLQGVLTLAKYTVNFAPMLAILFIAARMRALQIDPKHGNPQRWAQMCFYACTCSVLVQTLLVIIMPLCTTCECLQGACEGDVIFDMEDVTFATIITCVRYAALIALYGGFTAVIASVFLISHPAGAELTPPISPAMQCVMNLAVQYFTIYLLLFVAITAKQFLHGATEPGSLPSSSARRSHTIDVIIAILDGAQKTVMFAPMLSMLFIGARMRALQLTKATDGTIPPSAGPQAWVQDGMFLSTWSVLVQLIMTIVVPIITGTPEPEHDETGHVKTPETAHKYVACALEVVRYICLLAMYGGVITVMVGVFLMTPETLPPYSNDETLVPQPPSVPTGAEME